MASLVDTLTLPAAQPTATGKEIHRLKVWAGRLYAAYGDYGANTGPIDVLALDLASPAGFVSEATLDTEETWTFRDFGGQLFVPYMDPTGAGDGLVGQLDVADVPGDWAVISTITPVPLHAMSVAQNADGLFIGGSENDGPTVWRSEDDGATWTATLAPRPDLTGYSRFYALTVQPDGSLLAYMAALHCKVYRLPVGGSWELLGVFWEVAEAWPFTWQGHAFDLCLRDGKPQGQVTDGPLMAYTVEGEAVRADIEATFPAGLFRDVLIDGDYAYVLDNNGTIHRGDTDGVWTVVLTVDVDARCFATDGDAWYFGTGDSKVYSTAR